MTTGLEVSTACEASVAAQPTAAAVNRAMPISARSTARELIEAKENYFSQFTARAGESITRARLQILEDLLACTL
jgi:hypothetical protein